jgi:hypothetical protein
MVGVSLLPVLPADEFMPRNPAHGRKQALVMDAAAPQLVFHHGASFR